MKASATAKLLISALITIAILGTSGATAIQDTPASCGVPERLGQSDAVPMHGGGLNSCGCHFNRKTGDCHCHRATACGCECEPESCKKKDGDS